MPSTPFLDAIAAILRNVETTTGLGAAYHDATDPQARRANRTLCEFCRACFDRPDTAALCRISCLNAATHSLASGEAFYYTCWAGLVFVTVAIAPRRIVRGGIAIGGFCAPGDDASLRQIVPDRLPPQSTRQDRRFFSEKLKSIRPIGPGELRGLGPFLLEATFSSGLNRESDFRRQADRYAQQRAIAEAAAALKKRPLTRLPIRAEHLVAAWASRAPVAALRRETATYLAALLQHCAWDLLRFKAHLRVLAATATRDRILKHREWSQPSQNELLLLSRLEQVPHIDEACTLVTEWLAGLRPEASPSLASEQRPLAERVTRWIQGHYREKVRLSGAAREVGASVSAIVQHLRRETGKTFHQLLVDIRISEVKRLLATTDLEVSAVAALCGFSDQSHLTRVLQHEINLTPGRFRSLLTLPRLDNTPLQ
jgi:AraC-like DNA-binding protein